ncbi:GFA family protein [Massilia aurea]|uniref:GFA family protein n=1 Tax=Massilia aurea TaxID=373040 RepID=UPI003461D5BE
MTLSGGCFCGAVRFETDGAPFNSTLCHCADCRRVSGAPAVAWFSVPTNTLRWLAGQMQVRRSSPQAVRGFCAACGTTLTYQNDSWPDEIDIATASLDDPNLVPPLDHTFVRSRLDWLKLDDGLPQFQTTRTNS